MYKSFLVFPLLLLTGCLSDPAESIDEKKAAQQPAGVPEKAAPTTQTGKVCDYEVKDAKPFWTAYKYTEKAAVGGTFNTFTVSKSKQAPNVMESMNNLSIEIDTSSVESNNPARNKTIADIYFAKFAPANVIKGKVVATEGDNKQGTMKINLDMNGVAKDVDFKYDIKGEELEATAVMDMMDFNLKGPFDAIHEACKALHTGTDGVAKTWTEVALKITAQVKVSCN